jgi:hypothetical protein
LARFLQRERERERERERRRRNLILSKVHAQYKFFLKKTGKLLLKIREAALKIQRFNRSKIQGRAAEITVEAMHPIIPRSVSIRPAKKLFRFKIQKSLKSERYGTVFGSPVHKYAARVHEYATCVREYATPVHEYATCVHEYATCVHEYAACIREYAAPVHEYATCVHEYAARIHGYGFYRNESIHISY